MKVAIIGAGFAGLTTAKYLHEFGHEAVIFEKVQDVGGVWSASRAYPGVSTQNGKGTYHLSDWPMPKNYPEWPTGQQVQAYMESYVEAFGLARCLRLNTAVTNAMQDKNGKWTITTKDGDDIFDFLVVANGIFSKPSVPKFTGQDSFLDAKGRICHSSEFTNLDDANGKHVLVVGYGKSSCDVAVAIANNTKSTNVIARELIWKAPKKLGGVLNYKFLLLNRLGEGLFKYIQLRGVEKFLHGIGRPIRNSMIGSVQSLVIAQLGLKKLGLVPRGSFDRIARSTVSLTTDGFYKMVKKGTIKVHRDTQIKCFEMDGTQKIAVLENGTRLPADIVICGTGWQQEVPFFDKAIQKSLMDDNDNFMLYNCVKPIEIDNLIFNGYNSSFFSPLSTEIIALWLIAYLEDDIQLPSKDRQRQITTERLAWMAERTEGKHARGTNIIPFSMHQIDELLEDLRLPIGFMQRFMEWQLPIKPTAYKKVTKKLKKRLGKLKTK